MKRIFKYNIDPFTHQQIEIQSNGILSVAEQFDNIEAYAISDDNMDYNKFEFLTLGTGHAMPQDIDDYKFLGTVKLHNGSLMFHVFYKML